MLYLRCVVKFQLRKLGCALTLYKKAVPQLRNCVALQLNQKVHCRSCAALQKAKKLICAFCAALSLVKKIVALCCAALLIYCYLRPPLITSSEVFAVSVLLINIVNASTIKLINSASIIMNLLKPQMHYDVTKTSRERNFRSQQRH